MSGQTPDAGQPEAPREPVIDMGYLSLPAEVQQEIENPPMAKVCEHFYASHCYRGMSIRLCMLCHEPDWDDLAEQLSGGAVADAAVPDAASPAPMPAKPGASIAGPSVPVSGEAVDALGDLRAELGEARSEGEMIRDHAGRYLRAVYGPDVVYRAPETFGNLLERWIWAVNAGVPEIAHASIAEIERHFAERGESGHG